MALAPVVMIKAVLGFLDNADMASFSVCNSVLSGIVTTTPCTLPVRACLQTLQQCWPNKPPDYRKPTCMTICPVWKPTFMTLPWGQGQPAGELAAYDRTGQGFLLGLRLQHFTIDLGKLLPVGNYTLFKNWPGQLLAWLHCHPNTISNLTTLSITHAHGEMFLPHRVWRDLARLRRLNFAGQDIQLLTDDPDHHYANFRASTSEGFPSSPPPKLEEVHVTSRRTRNALALARGNRDYLQSLLTIQSVLAITFSGTHLGLFPHHNNTTLQRLNISDTKFLFPNTTLPANLLRLTSLTHLDVSQTNVVSLTGIEALLHLVTFEGRCMIWLRDASALGLLPHLEDIDLSYCTALDRIIQPEGVVFKNLGGKAVRIRLDGCHKLPGSIDSDLEERGVQVMGRFRNIVHVQARQRRLHNVPQRTSRRIRTPTDRYMPNAP